MPLCKICHVEVDLEPLYEQTKVIDFPIKTWYCSKCGFKRWPLNKEEYLEWDRLYAEKLKKPIQKRETKCVFETLKHQDKKPKWSYVSEGLDKHQHKCGGDCSCDSDDGCGQSGGCSGCGH